ncbi:hypothetical protein BU17DRAFT_103275 [Hysterangium stoloniferum]|nr:hypothetical protein BU17DRAFT_103558 [Hysterangium stoloniferum]KAF8497328.1 hypothetical protein BU17DRAFT_103275 [Hysterangium stoloniferum]
MKFTLPLISATLLSGIFSTYAQTVSFVSPPRDSVVHAGQPFTVSVRFSDTIASIIVVALALGQQSTGDTSDQDLGERILATVPLPTFSQTGPQGQPFVQNVSLTIPTDTQGLVNITCAQFYTVGADNFPEIFVTKTRVNVQ